MTISNYTDLQTAVKDWSNRFDTTVAARVPDFIRLAEERIWQTGEHVVRSQWGVTNAPLVVPAAQNWVALPTDWLGFVRIRSSAEPRIEYLPPDQLEGLPQPGNASKYSVEGGRLLYGQTPGANLTLTVRYYAHPGLLATVATTWLLQKAPSIYLYAALLEAAIFIKNSAKVSEFGALLDKALVGFDSVERASLISGGRLRTPGRF